MSQHLSIGTPKNDKMEEKNCSAQLSLQKSDTTLVSDGQPKKSTAIVAVQLDQGTGKVKTRLSEQQLARLADPTDFHVMPSSFENKEKSAGLMEPPTRVLPRQTIMDEDDFADCIGEIVQRDFFPDLPKLKAQVAWLEAKEHGDTEMMQEISTQYTRSLRRKLQGSVMNTPTPLTSQGSDTPITSSRPGSEDQTSRATNASDDLHVTKHEGLDEWLSTHNGEDNASFEEILEKDKAAHREKHWWVYDDHAKAGKGYRMLKDGTVERIVGNPNDKRLALQQATDNPNAGVVAIIKLGSENVMVNKNGDEAPHKLGAGAGMGVGGWKGDDRKGNFDMAPHRNRNHLMFQPQLSVSREICGIYSQNEDDLGTKRKGKNVVEFRKDRKNLHVEKAPKEIKHNNTRFIGDPDQQNEAAAVMAAAVDAERQKAIKERRGRPQQMDGQDYDFVNTPQIIPGENMTPLMTWGAIEGTPMILRDAMAMTPINLEGSSGNDFKIKESGRREKLASRLEEEVRAKQKRKRERASSIRRRPQSEGASKSATPWRAGSTSNRSYSRLMTPTQRRLSALSPAAQSMIRRLGSTRSVGGMHIAGTRGTLDSQLRASYSGTPYTPSRRRYSSNANTPQSTPRLRRPSSQIVSGHKRDHSSSSTKPSRKKKAKKRNRRVSESTKVQTRSSNNGESVDYPASLNPINPITDNLLKL